MSRLVDGLYIFCMGCLFILAGKSVLSGTAKVSDLEDVGLVIFWTVLSTVMLCYVMINECNNDDRGERK